MIHSNSPNSLCMKNYTNPYNSYMHFHKYPGK